MKIKAKLPGGGKVKIKAPTGSPIMSQFKGAIQDAVSSAPPMGGSAGHGSARGAGPRGMRKSVFS